MTRIASALAATLLSVALIAPAHAGAGWTNGTRMNGFTFNGSKVNGATSDSRGVRLEAIELPPSAQ